jgi:hypothetical protein
MKGRSRETQTTHGDGCFSPQRTDLHETVTLFAIFSWIDAQAIRQLHILRLLAT